MNGRGSERGWTLEKDAKPSDLDAGPLEQLGHQRRQGQFATSLLMRVGPTLGQPS
jgi:hypothetical protein